MQICAGAKYHRKQLTWERLVVVLRDCRHQAKSRTVGSLGCPLHSLYSQFSTISNNHAKPSVSANIAGMRIPRRP